MEISPKVFDQAQKHQRNALEELLAAVYPVIVRLARGLCGREDVAEGVVRFVVLKGVTMVARWRDENAAERWFLHHTVLTARRAAAHQPNASQDLLATGGDPRYVAFVRAFRQLPQQQREAVLLNFGERFNARYLSIAMDCSTEAAQNHLDSGMAALKNISGVEFGPLVDRLATVYAHLGPLAESVPPAVGRWVKRGLRPRRVRRAIWLLVGVVVVVALAAAAWRWRAALGW